ncbi:MAG: alkaline phosphatase, partial [Calditrichaeota bacterium]|nr:alkaline phosphatase [Calditrichota bacterium]
PVNNAEFLPGAFFDLRIEVQADALPEDFAVSINGQDASEFFGAEAVEESWQLGEESPVTVSAATWRGVTLPEAGDYMVSVMADTAETSVAWSVYEPQEAVAQNVILFIADGMTIPEITAARVATFGIDGGKVNGEFAIDSFEEIGLVHTNSVDSMMMDSANTASAMNTGHKGSVNATGIYADSSPDVLDDPRVETLAEILRRTT